MLTGIIYLSKKYNLKNKIFSKFTIEWKREEYVNILF